MYLVTVLRADRRVEIYKWWRKSLQRWVNLGTILLKYDRAMSLDLHLRNYTRIHICYAGKAGPKGDKGDPAVEIDIVAELCKHLPREMVEQYRRGAYV